jgi:hypothetical protein
MTKAVNATKPVRSADGSMIAPRKGVSPVDFRPVTKRGSITELQAERAVRAYLSEARKK